MCIHICLLVLWSVIKLLDLNKQLVKCQNVLMQPEIENISHIRYDW